MFSKCIIKKYLAGMAALTLLAGAAGGVQVTWAEQEAQTEQAAPAEETPETVYDLAQRTMTSYIQGPDGTQTSVTAYTFSENGLMDTISVQNGDQMITSKLEYTFDEQGYPTGFTFDGTPFAAFDAGADGAQESSADDAGAEAGLTAQIQNTYENGVLVEAQVTGIQTEGRELLGAQPADHGSVSANDSSLLIVPVSAIEHFTGYVDAQLTVAGWEELTRRYEGGRIVESGSLAPGMWTAQSWVYGEDGSVEASTRTDQWQGGKWVTRSTQVIVTDARNIVTEIRFISEDQTVNRKIRYEEETDPATGKKVLAGYQEGVDDPEYQGTPLMRYTLDENGAPASMEELTSGVTWQYDSQGRATLQQIAPGGELRYEIAYQYRN